jgi:hypothetical protein
MTEGPIRIEREGKLAFYASRVTDKNRARVEARQKASPPAPSPEGRGGNANDMPPPSPEGRGGNANDMPPPSPSGEGAGGEAT